MTATVTLTPTPQPANVPPRVQLDVTATGTPTVTSVTISRTDPDGSTKLVRTSDGGPLVLSAGAGTMFDYEAPPGVTVTYSLPEGSAPSVDTELDTAAAWLVHLGQPSRSVLIDLRPGSDDAETWGIDQGVFPILGRETPIVITGNTRIAPATRLMVGADDDADKQALKDLLTDGSPLLLSIDPVLGFGLDTAYIAVGPVTVHRPIDNGIDPHRILELPYQVIGRPAGGTRALVTWADVATTYSTWSSIPAGKTWAQVAAGS